MDATEPAYMLASVRHFVRHTVVPLEEEIEHTDQIPDRIRKTCKDMGLYGFGIPAEYGGIGLSANEESSWPWNWVGPPPHCARSSAPTTASPGTC